jgi:hypothetical protein
MPTNPNRLQNHNPNDYCNPNPSQDIAGTFPDFSVYLLDLGPLLI